MVIVHAESAAHRHNCPKPEPRGLDIGAHPYAGRAVELLHIDAVVEDRRYHFRRQANPGALRPFIRGYHVLIHVEPLVALGFDERGDLGVILMRDAHHKVVAQRGSGGGEDVRVEHVVL